LYVGWGDVHRCGFDSAIGSFCEHYGAGGKFGTLADWPSPHQYTPAEVVVPPFLPDNALVRADLAGQYTAWTRLDAGVGVILREVAAAGAADTTLTIFFSDNGIPFPSGKTNLLEQGQHEPLLIARPGTTDGHRSSQVVSSLDLAPTMLQWANVHYPSHATAGGHPAVLTG
jgi:N-sulfoglucosamine sulfohydrolase